jgi:hypothetical protein
MQGDEARGRLASDPFPISGDRIAFQIAGGADEERLHVALEVDGREVERTTGMRSDHMRSVRWDVGAFRGHTGRIVIVDASADRWGRISADGFCYTN